MHTDLILLFKPALYFSDNTFKKYYMLFKAEILSVTL